MPAGSERERNSAIREVVDHRPLFSDTNRIVKRYHYAARAYLNALRDGGKRGAGYGGIWIWTTKGVEMSLGRPNRGEVVFIGEFRALNEQLVNVFVAAGLVVGKIKQAEIHPFQCYIRGYFGFSGESTGITGTLDY